MKPEAEYFSKVEQLLAAKPEEILFIDDQEKNVSSARTQGWHTYQYSDSGSSINDILKMLIV